MCDSGAVDSSTRDAARTEDCQSSDGAKAGGAPVLDVAPGLGLGQFEKLGSHAGAPGNRDGVQGTWVDWKLSSHRMLSLTQMAVGWCARRGFRFSGRTRVATVIGAVSTLPLIRHGKDIQTRSWVIPPCFVTSKL
jgi:hypothetical protein